MYRIGVSRFRALKGQSCNLRPARFATSSAVASSSASSGDLFTWLTGEKASSLPPLEFPFEGVNLPPPLADYIEPSKTKITTLCNGVKIASELSSNPAACIGLFVDCGSIYETPINFGATHLLELMAFKSTFNRSHLRIIREVEAIGGNIIAAASREQMSYAFDALRTYVPQMVELLVDCVRNPVFLDWEVNEQLQKAKLEVEELSNDPQGLLLEALHSAGYSGALANPLMAHEAALNRLDGDILEEFVNENYTAPRMVLAASGVEHEQLLSIARPLLSDLPNVPCPKEPKSVYVGGDYRCQADSVTTHVALAFEIPGGLRDERESVLATVLQMLMGGGGSFSIGGPGKGIYSRLYRHILAEDQRIQSFSAFSRIYSSTGIFGIHASMDSHYVGKAVSLAVGELISVATPGKVDEVEVNRAKEATKSAVLMNLESRMIASENIGRQILTYGERKPLESLLKAVDAITVKDITSFVQKIISSPLTMASYGDVAKVPSYESVSSHFW
ncbi:hypothetical protein Ancab_012287 [Ancistrocladus abbreviatus]